MSSAPSFLQPRRRPWWRHPVVQFVAAGLVTLAVLLAGSSWLGQRAATEAAVLDARDTTELLASLVEPAVTPGLVNGQSAELDRFDRLVNSRVLGGNILRIKLWRADGTIVYSDRLELIGEQFDLDADDKTVLAEGGSAAGTSDLTEEENRFEQDFGRLLEVYTRINAPNGEPLLFEAYFSWVEVTDRSGEVLDAFRPITVAGLLLFLGLTAPLVWVLARRLDAAAADRERLLLAAVGASDAERRRIARDLHDGVVQDLAGTSFALSATARDLDDRPETAQRLAGLGTGVRASLRALRSLLVEIYPPDLQTEGLAAALDDLVAPAVADGVTVDVAVGDTAGLPDDVVALLWRAAQETVRNALRHGAPTRLRVRVTRPSGRVVLEVDDDGRGFEPEHLPTRDHLGLRALADLVRDSGGTMQVQSQPGDGARVTVEVPTT